MITINHSSIGLLACPRKYQLRVCLQVDDPPNEAMLLGSAVHALIEQYQLAGRDFASFMPKMQEALNLVCDKYELKDGAVKGKVLTAFLGVAPQVRSAAVKNGTIMCEYKFTVRYNDYIELIGTIDEESDKDGAPLLTDYKTTSYVTMADVLAKYQYSSQLGFYSLAYERLFGELPLSRYLVIPYKKTPVLCASTPPIRTDIKRTMSLVESAAVLIDDIQQQTKRGELSSPVGMACGSCIKCNYRTICHSTDPWERIKAAKKSPYEPLKFR